MYASWMNDLKEFVSEIVIYKKKIYDHNYLYYITHHNVANKLWINLRNCYVSQDWYLKINAFWKSGWDSDQYKLLSQLLRCNGV